MHTTGKNVFDQPLQAGGIESIAVQKRRNHRRDNAA
jgi:hypothetical protein